MKVLLVIDIQDLSDKVVFDKHLKKEGFSPVASEEYAYSGDTSTHLNSTRAYILDVVTMGLKKSSFSTCKIIFQVGDNKLEAFAFNKIENYFQETNI